MNPEHPLPAAGGALAAATALVTPSAPITAVTPFALAAWIARTVAPAPTLARKD